MTPQEAAQKILEGELVVFPTETVYGLGALASDDHAVRRIFEVKGRPAHNPLILHIADNDQVKILVSDISPAAQKLLDHFWPGPLTICFQKSALVSDLVSGGLQTVCVRRPHHPLAQEFLKKVGHAVAAPSANLSGRPSTTTYEDARHQLQEKGVFFLDGGQSPLGIESTVIDCSSLEVKILRPGSISKEELEKVLGRKISDESMPTEKISSPGQLLEHYAPRGNLVVLYGSRSDRDEWKATNITEPQDWVFGTFADEIRPFMEKKYVLAPSEGDLEKYASNLYAFLNWCDRENARSILLDLPNLKHPLLSSLLNRLEKASRGQIVTLG